MNVKNRTVFSNDNLPVLRGIDTESVDLIYLDPPFNSNRNYAAPIGSDAAGAAFKDTWTLSDVDNAWHGEIADREPALYQAIHAAELTHGKGMKSYLIMLAVRLLEKKRVRLEAEIGIFGDVIHRTDIPKRSEKLPNYRTHKHTLFGKQEGLCNGCRTQFPFRNMTVDHIVPQSQGGTDHEDNLQLLCGACNSTKGQGTQAELISRLKAQGVLR